MPKLTASDLLQLARSRGVTALGVPPRAGAPTKILLASIVDAADPEVRRRLVELNRAGEIRLTRVDAIGLMPEDRAELYKASRFWDACCWFDCIAFDGALLLGGAA